MWVCVCVSVCVGVRVCVNVSTAGKRFETIRIAIDTSNTNVWFFLKKSVQTISMFLQYCQVYLAV